MSDLNDRIRARAYLIWEAEGKPEGCEERHWHEAAAQVRAEIEAEDAVPTPVEKPKAAKAPVKAAAAPKKAAAAPKKAAAKTEAKAEVKPTVDEKPAKAAASKKAASRKSAAAPSALH